MFKQIIFFSQLEFHGNALNSNKILKLLMTIMQFTNMPIHKLLNFNFWIYLVPIGLETLHKLTGHSNKTLNITVEWNLHDLQISIPF